MRSSLTNNPNGFETVLVTGGGGYVGSALVPDLLRRRYRVRVADLFWYGHDVFGADNAHPSLERIEADIRDHDRLSHALIGVDAVIHLACISNDPSFELDPALGKSINYDAFACVVDACIARRVQRFIYASSSSIYGVKSDLEVTEDTTPEPLTDYSAYKLQCERDLLARHDAGAMERVIVRPSTVCGYAPRMRFDLIVNILTIHALVNQRIRIFGGDQLRPNLHMKDMVRAYQHLLDAPAALVNGEAFNVGYQNKSVREIAHLVRDTLGDTQIAFEQVPSDDTRSYHVNAEKIARVLGFRTEHTIADAVRDIAAVYRSGAWHDPLTNPLYHNIRQMQQLVTT